MLRPMTRDDARAIYEIASDPSTRRGFLNPSSFTWEEHKLWLERYLADPSRRFFVIEVESRVAGYVRFDHQEISIALAPWARGRSFSSRAIREGVVRSGFHRVVAKILPENSASIRAFEKAGFVLAGKIVTHGRVALLYETNEIIVNRPLPLK